jgi:hypothetical protein
VYISNPRVAAEVIRVERIISPRFPSHPAETAAEAWRIVNRSDFSPNVIEDPLFKSLLGYVASCCTPARLSEARTAFSYAAQMKFEPNFRYLLAWFMAERSSGVFDEWCETICDMIISGTSYSEAEKIMMISRKAISVFARGKYKLTTDYVDAIRCIRESLGLHLRAFRLNCLAGNTYADVSENLARNTMFTLFNAMPRESPWEHIDVIRSLCESKDVYLDPIEDVVQEFVSVTVSFIKRTDVANRTRQRLKGLPDVLSSKELWLSSGTSQRVVGRIKTAESTLEDLLKK